MTDQHRPRRTGVSMPRMLLALAFVLTRLLAAPHVAAADRQQAIDLALLADSAICHAAGAEGTAPASDPARHPAGHTHDCGLCPACHALSAPTLLPAVVLLPSRRPRVAAARFIAMQATGPPAAGWAPAQPRGPPTLRV